MKNFMKKTTNYVSSLCIFNTVNNAMQHHRISSEMIEMNNTNNKNNNFFYQNNNKFQINKNTNIFNDRVSSSYIEGDNIFPTNNLNEKFIKDSKSVDKNQQHLNNKQEIELQVFSSEKKDNYRYIENNEEQIKKMKDEFQKMLNFDKFKINVSKCEINVPKFDCEIKLSKCEFNADEEFKILSNYLNKKNTIKINNDFINENIYLKHSKIIESK